MAEFIPKLKIILARPSDTGRSELLLKYIDNQFESNYKPVVGIDFFVKKIEGVADLLIWDISPQAQFALQRRIFFAGASGAILVFNCMDQQSWQQIQIWYTDIIHILGQIPFLLIGTYKGDSPLNSSTSSNKEFKEFAQSRNGLYIEASSKGSTDLNTPFLWLINKILEKIKH
jgi:GTPase SAR1 family protein